MRRLYRSVFLLFLAVWFVPALTVGGRPQHSAPAGSGAGSASAVFIANHGQWSDEALFCLPTTGLPVWCTAAGLVYEYRGSVVRDNGMTMQQGRILRMEFVGASTSPAIRTSHPVQTRYNFFSGRDTTRWAADVPAYREIVYGNVYRNVDMRLYLDDGRPRYDIILQPGCDPEAVWLRFRGMERLDAGERELRFGMGADEIVQGGLFAYQVADGVQREVPCRFVTRDNGDVGFRLGVYDPALPVVVDPLVYSTFVGGTLGDESYGIDVDSYGNTYIVGTTVALNYPTTTGAYDTTKAGGSDIIVSKLNASGAGLVYSTFIGGDDDDYGYDIAVDALGRAAITGLSYSTDFPTTSQAWDATLGGDRDMVVARLNDNGNRLEGSTYLGGSNWDEGYAIAFRSGSIYVTGMSTSSDFPTVNAFDDSHNGAQDVVVAVLSANTATLSFSSFLGGQGVDEGNAVAVDNAGNIILAGTTGSSDFRTTTGAYDGTFNGGIGTTDAFVAKIAPQGTLVFSTFLGGTDNDEGRGVAVDQNGIYVGGTTSSGTPGFPVTAGAYDQTLNGIDAFLARLNASGSTLSACTYVGQAGDDAIADIAVDADGLVYATGYTRSSSLPTTPNGYDRTFNGGDADAFLVQFSSSLGTSSLQYGTYLGGNNNDEAKRVAVDNEGNAYVSGVTRSGNFPTTIGSYSRTFGGLSDAFVSKIGTGEPRLTLTEPTGGELWCVGDRQKITWTSRSVTYIRIELSSNGGATYPTVLADTVPAATGAWSWTIPTALTPGNQYRVRIVSLADSQLRDAGKDSFTINAPPVITAQPVSVTACVGTTATLQVGATAYPAATVQWQVSTDNGATWTNVPAPAGTQNPLLVPNVQLSQHNRQYRVVLSNLCNPEVVSSAATLSVRAQPTILAAPQNASVCEGGTVVLSIEVDEPGVRYQWRRNGQPLAGGTGRQLTLSNATPANAGQYDVVVTGACPPAIISTAAVVSVQAPPEVARPPAFRSILCPGETRDTTMTLTNTGPLDLTVSITGITNPRFTVVEPTGDFVLPSGGSRQITLRFTPTRAQLEYGELVMNTQPCNHELRVQIGARADSVRLGAANVEFEPMYQCDTVRTAVVRIVNSGTVAVPVHRVNFSHPNFSLLSPSLPFTVEAGSRWVDAVVAFTDDGLNDPVSATATFASDTCAALAASPKLTVRRGTVELKPSASPLDFGTLASCDSHADRTFMLFNTGTAEVTVDSMAVDNAAFGVVQPVGPFTLKPGEPKEITVRFTGGSGGAVSGRLLVYDNLCRIGTPVLLNGSKAGSSLLAGTTSLAVGTFLSCADIPDTSFALANFDADTVLVDAAMVGAPFEVVAPEFPVRIAPGDSVRVVVRTQPGAEGTFAGEAVFSYRTEGCSSSVMVALSVSRLQPMAGLAPSSIAAMEIEACEAFRDTVVDVSNTGQTPVTIVAYSGSAALSLLNTLPVSLKPGQRVPLTVRVEPSAGGAVDELLVLHLEECDAAVELPVRVHKHGVSFAIAAAGGGDTLRFDNVVDCGEQKQTKRLKIGVAVEDGGTPDATVSFVTLSPPGPFTVALKPGEPLAAGEQWFDVEFAPTADGDYGSVLSVTFEPCGITRRLVLAGRKVRGVLSGPTAPVDFGTVQQGAVRTQKVVVRNTGTAALQIGTVAVPPPFALLSATPQLPASVAPGDSLTLMIEYTAGTGREQATAVISVTGPCSDSLAVELTGEGRDLPGTTLFAPSLAFGDVLLGTQATRTLIVTNKGPSEAVLYGVPIITGADAADFLTATRPAETIPPGGSTSFDLVFRPLAPGDRKAACRIEYNGLPLEVELTGRGVEQGPASSSVVLPDTSATPYTRGLRLPLQLIPGDMFSYAAVDSFTAEIRFNATLFLPTSVEHAVVVADTTIVLDTVSERVLTVSGRHRDTTELCVLVGDVLLGDALATPLALSFVWHTPGAGVETHDGRLALLGVREDDLVRLKGLPGIVAVAPNPSDAAAVVDIRAIEDGRHVLELFDAAGRQAWSTSWVHSSDRGRLGVVYSFTVPSAQVASGVYSLRYRAPGGRTDVRTIVVLH